MIARDGSRRVIGSCVCLVLLAVVFRLWGQQGTWFYQDDFRLVDSARSQALTLEYLFTARNGHLMPAGLLLNWVNTSIAPLDFVFPATEMILGFAVAGLGLVKLLVRLFGPRWGICVPLSLFLFSPLLIPATTWWTAAIVLLPVLISLAFGLDAFVGYLQGAGRRTFVVHVSWLVVGLAFSERAVLLPVLAWTVAFVWFTQGSGPDRLRLLWVRHRPAVLTHLCVLGSYAVLYLWLAVDVDALGTENPPFFELVRDMAWTAFSTAFVGGPIDWLTVDAIQQEAHPPALLSLLGPLLLGALIYASARTRRRGLRAWALPAVALVLAMAFVALREPIGYAAGSVLDYRSITEMAFATALAVGGSFLSVRGALEPSVTHLSAWRLDRPVVAGLAVVIFVLIATISTSRFPLRALEANGNARELLVYGDSLTQGSSGDWTWRCRLSDHLQQRSQRIDFVGPRDDLRRWRAGTLGDRRYPDGACDTDHSALWGAKLTEPDYDFSDTVARFRPDVVVALIGYNDVAFVVATPSEIEERWRKEIRDARTWDPQVDVVLVQVPNTWVSGIARYNTVLLRLARELDSPHSRVVTTATPHPQVRRDTYDGTHPSAQGEVLIAAAVADALARMRLGEPWPRPARDVRPGPWFAPTPRVVAHRSRLRVSWPSVQYANAMRVWTRDVSKRSPWQVTERLTTSHVGIPAVPGREYAVRLQPVKGFLDGGTLSSTVRVRVPD